MSSFNAPTKHPVTGKVEKATWIDDHFGRHRYGVSFPGDKTIYDPDAHDLHPLESTKEPHAPTLQCIACGSHSITETWEPGVLECMACGAKGKKA
jgi:hypothetical protein